MVDESWEKKRKTKTGEKIKKKKELIFLEL